MALRILVLGHVSPETLRELRGVDGGSEVLEGDAARGVLERVATEGIHVVAVGTPRTGRIDEAHPLLRALDSEFARAVRYRHPISLLCLSVDGLDALLRAHGEGGIAAYIAGLEEAVRASLRGMDLAARLDENEIAVILPHTGGAGATAVAGRLRTLAARLLVKPATLGERTGLPLKGTCSIGVAEAPAEGVVTPRDMLSRARDAMDTARSQGGDRVANS